MNQKQKALLKDIAFILTVTAIVVIAMINFKDWIRHTEAMRAVEQIGQKVLDYRKENGSLPRQSYLDEIVKTVEGYVRLGELKYRARWIDYDSDPNEIMAYSKKIYHSLLLPDGYIVLQLDGTVEWMTIEQFEPLLEKQQTTQEKQVHLPPLK